jgi:hypothetical protein
VRVVRVWRWKLVLCTLEIRQMRTSSARTQRAVESCLYEGSALSSPPSSRYGINPPCAGRFEVSAHMVSLEVGVELARHHVHAPIVQRHVVQWQPHAQQLRLARRRRALRVRVVAVRQRCRRGGLGLVSGDELYLCEAGLPNGRTSERSCGRRDAGRLTVRRWARWMASSVRNTMVATRVLMGPRSAMR